MDGFDARIRNMSVAVTLILYIHGASGTLVIKRHAMSRQRGQTFQIERVPPELWRRVKARAALEGRTVRAVLLARLEEYATGRVTPNDHYLSESIGRPAAASMLGESQPDTH